MGGSKNVPKPAYIINEWSHRPRSAKSVEDIVDRRVSSLSTTSGCSDCTTATLQGAKSYGSSFFSGKSLSNFYGTQFILGFFVIVRDDEGYKVG